MKKISKIMWGTILGLFVLSFVVSLAGGNGSVISHSVGYIIPFAFVIQIIIWIIGRKKSSSD